MELLKETLDNVVNYISPFLPLVSSHTVNYIVNNSWEKVVPENIQIEVEEKGTQHVIYNFLNGISDSSELANFIQKTNCFDIENYKFFSDIDHVKNKLIKQNIKKPINITEFMTSKKLHEVKCMSDIVAIAAKYSNSSLIIDIGSGKGYLSSMLAIHHELRILGIDNKSTNIDGAVRTTKNLEKRWKVYERKMEKLNQLNTYEKLFKKSSICVGNREHGEENNCRRSTLGNVYKQRIENITMGTNLKKILSEEYPCETLDNILLIGLHTCGNLATDSLKLFVNNQNCVQSMINIGCCYHLIDEEFATDEVWNHLKLKKKNITDFGFPMSEHLKTRQFSLGRNAMMCGTQNPLKIFRNEEKLIKATKPLFFRALLQEMLVRKIDPDNFPSTVVGRMAHKCDSFLEYANKALVKLSSNIRIEADELIEFEKINCNHWERLKIFFLLKASLSSVIETIILLDRLLYLQEKGITNGFITRLFDPIISPRCYAVMAIRNYNVN